MKTAWWGTAAMAMVISAGATGCASDARFKKVTDGISKDSVAVLSGGAVAHRVATYMTDGKLWEIQFFAKADRVAGDSIAWREMTPVVYADEKVAGLGWSYWDKKATELRIPMPPK